MAKAQFVETDKPNVILELTFKEAQSVHLITGKILGLGSVRQQTNAVYQALNDLLQGKDSLPNNLLSGYLTIEEPQENQ